MSLLLPCLLAVVLGPPPATGETTLDTSAGEAPPGHWIRGMPKPVDVPDHSAETTADAGGQDHVDTSDTADDSGTSETTATSTQTSEETSTPSDTTGTGDDSGDSWVADGDGFDFDFGALSGDPDAPGNDTQRDGDGPPLDASPETLLEGPEETVDTTKRKTRIKAGEILSGALRLTGAFLHVPDEPLLFPNGDDGMVLGEGRFIINSPAGDHVRFDVNTFIDVSRLPSGGTLSGAFTSASTAGSVYRTRYLSWNYWQNGDVSGNLGLDRLAMSILAGPVKIDVGRFPVNYTVTGAFTPNDVFSPFSATTVNRIFKPGVDALRFSFAAGTLATIDVLGVMGYGTDDVPSWARSSVFARAGFVAGGFEWAALGGKLAERWIVGGSAQGDAGPIGLRTEFHVGFPDREGNGRKKTDDELPIYTRISAGPNVSFTWHNVSLAAEYMFVSDGKSSPADYIARVTNLMPDDIPYLGKHYVSASFGLDLIPILRLQTLGLVNASDASGLAGLTLAYNAADEVDLIVGSFIPWGKKLQNVDPMAGTFDLGSEYGLSALTIYLETRVFF